MVYTHSIQCCKAYADYMCVVPALLSGGLSATRHMLRFYAAATQPGADILNIFSKTMVAPRVHCQTFTGTAAAIIRPVGEADEGADPMLRTSMSPAKRGGRHAQHHSHRG
jgi:hypothetical protein